MIFIKIICLNSLHFCSIDMFITYLLHRSVNFLRNVLNLKLLHLKVTRYLVQVQNCSKILAREEVLKSEQRVPFKGLKHCVG